MADFVQREDIIGRVLTRRAFLKGARYLALPAATIPWLFRGWVGSALAAVDIQEIHSDASTPAPMIPQPSPPSISPESDLFQSPQTYSLQLGGQAVQVFGFQGGEPVAQYVTGTVAPDGSLPKKLSGLRYQDIVFYYLPIPGAGLNTWLIDSMQGKAPPVSGEIHILSSGISVPHSNRVSFAGAVAKQIAFPEADRASEMPAPLRITLAIQQAEWFPQSVPMGQPLQSNPFGGPLKGLFKLSIHNLDTSDVMRVESMVFSTTIIPPSRGNYQSSIPRDLSTLRIQLPESKAGDLYAWHKDFVMKGMNSDARERAGTIQWLSPQSQSPPQPVLTLKLSRLGILSVVRLPSKPGYVQVEMYCQKLVPHFF